MLEKQSNLDSLQSGLFKALNDSDPIARSHARDAFQYFTVIWPNRGNKCYYTNENIFRVKSGRKKSYQQPKDTRKSI
jgi:hypothetical protein